MAVWLTYNGNGLTYGTCALGYVGGPHPRPIMENGVVRFSFANTSIDLATLQSITYGNGTWTQVIDAETGNPVSGMWDFKYDRSRGLFSENFQNGITTQNVGYAEIVDLRENNGPNANYWQEAFTGDTAITKVNITQFSGTGTMIRMFSRCTSLTEAHVEAGSASNTEVMFDNCSSLHTVYVSTYAGIGPSMFLGCTSIVNLTIETTSPSGGAFFGNDNDGALVSFKGTVEEITLIRPDTASVRLTTGGYESGMFNGCVSLHHVNCLERDSNDDLSPCRMLIGSAGTKTRMFYGCTSLEAIPPLTIGGMSFITSVDEMFSGCRNVRSGIAGAYDVLSAATPNTHFMTFKDCGIDTPQGLAELQTVPLSWGGLAAG